MILRNVITVVFGEGVPHTGGGDPIVPVIFIVSVVCSPHRWG